MLYVFLIVKCIYWLFYFDLLFGADSIIYVKSQSIGGLKDLGFLLYLISSPPLNLLAILLTGGLACILLFTKKLQFLLSFILWFLVLNLNNVIYTTLTGGDFLTNQFLFFNCFLSLTVTPGENWSDQAKVCLHNIACYGIMIQLCLVYFVSALAKVNDSDWFFGKAIIKVSQIEHFSMYSFLSYRKSLDPVLIFLNYVILFYQLSFPIFVWIKKIKKPLLLFGILMHVYIALVMGLIEFGAIMVLAYVYFWPKKQSIS